MFVALLFRGTAFCSILLFTLGPQIKDLVEDVCSQIASKCYLVGKCLGLDEDVLDTIQDQSKDRELEASYTIMIRWLYHTPEPTWKKLIDVLASEVVGEYTLAEFLSEKYNQLHIL